MEGDPAMLIEAALGLGGRDIPGGVFNPCFGRN